MQDSRYYGTEKRHITQAYFKDVENRDELIRNQDNEFYKQDTPQSREVQGVMQAYNQIVGNDTTVVESKDSLLALAEQLVEKSELSDKFDSDTVQRIVHRAIMQSTVAGEVNWDSAVGFVQNTLC